MNLKNKYLGYVDAVAVEEKLSVYFNYSEPQSTALLQKMEEYNMRCFANNNPIAVYPQWDMGVCKLLHSLCSTIN
jgi:hypothetical protein